jgi:hypothetical protein
MVGVRFDDSCILVRYYLLSSHIKNCYSGCDDGCIFYFRDLLEQYMLNYIPEGSLLKRFDSKVIGVRVRFFGKKLLCYFSPLNMTDCNIYSHGIANKLTITHDNIMY